MLQKTRNDVADAQGGPSIHISISIAVIHRSLGNVKRELCWRIADELMVCLLADL